MSTLNVDKVDPSTGTALEIGSSGDTVSLPSGATLDISASTLTPPATMPASSGINFTALNATNLGSGTVPTARLGTGTASSTTVLYGDQTYKTEPSGITAADFIPLAQPILINGNMAISQRATSVASVSTLGYRACDRWLPNPQSFGTWTMSQDSDSPDGFGTSYKFDCTTANASPAATGQIFQLQQRMEGQNLQMFKKGTSDAETYTVAFWVKSTVTGTFNVNIQDNDNSRNVSTTWTVDAGDTWEKKICNLPADTTGVLDNDNANSMQVQFHFGASAGYAATDSTAWGAHGSAGLAYGVTGNMASSTSNNIYITGVQLEVGTYTSATVPPFRHESIGSNLARCQRYYILASNAMSQDVHIGYYYNATTLSIPYVFPVNMRAAPSADMSNGTSYFIFYRNGGSDLLNSVTQEASSTVMSLMRDNTTSSGTGGETGLLRQNNASARMAWAAEL